MCPSALAVIRGLRRGHKLLTNELNIMHEKQSKLQQELEIIQGREMVLVEELNNYFGKRCTVLPIAYLAATIQILGNIAIVQVPYLVKIIRKY